MRNVKVHGIALAVFAAAFLAGSIVSYLIEGIPRYQESAVSGLIIAGLMALQMHRNGKVNENA